MKSKIIQITMALMLIAGLFFMGCDNCINCRRSSPCCDGPYPLPIPSGVYSVTYDGFVEVFWNPIYSSDLDYYRIWRGYSASGQYTLIGETRSPFYTDYSVRNGQTYYYAISAVDLWGYETEMSRDIVHDTPRPEGHRYTIYAADLYPDDAGFNFQRRYVVPWDHVDCDVFFSWDDGIEAFYLQVGNDRTDIMHYGFTRSLQDVDYAPERGWDPEGWVIARESHSYIIWTAENNFAHLRIKTLYDDRIVFSWAYQTDPGNPELSVRPVREPIERGITTRRTIESVNQDLNDKIQEEK